MESELAPLTESGILAAISPSTYVDRIRAPLFVYGAENDIRTPVVQIDALVRDLRARGRKVEYMRAARVGHTRDPAIVAELSIRVLRFLRAELE
jgi:dipeptidyl aminopeptidase/acylaminoacyl peptidase